MMEGKVNSDNLINYIIGFLSVFTTAILLRKALCSHSRYNGCSAITIQDHVPYALGVRYL